MKAARAINDPRCILLLTCRAATVEAFRAGVAYAESALVIASTDEEALRFASRDPYDLIVIDADLPHTAALELARRLRAVSVSHDVRVALLGDVNMSAMRRVPSRVSDFVDYWQGGADPERVRVHMARLSDHAMRRDVQGVLPFFTATRRDAPVQPCAESLSTALDAAGDAIWLFDLNDLRIVHANQAALSRMQCSSGALNRLTVLDLFPEFDEAAFRRLIAPVSADRVREVERRTVTSGASGAQPVELIVRRGTATEMIAVVRTGATQVGAAAPELEAHTREQFLSIASHELKTPVTALQLQLQQLNRSVTRDPKSPTVGQRVVSKLASIERSSKRLTRLIDNLLDISKITTGRIDVTLEELDLASVVRGVVERAHDELASADCPVIVAIDAPVVGKWDKARLEQIFGHLLSNAAKYGARKPIEITVDASDAWARVCVRDQGIGISPEDQTRLFQRFERAVSERQYGGFGLGLWIARQLVIALNGSIHVESQPGRGACFIVDLPRRAPRVSNRVARITAALPSASRTAGFRMRR